MIATGIRDPGHMAGPAGPTGVALFGEVIAWLAFSIDGVEFLLDQRSMGEIASTVVLTDPSATYTADGAVESEAAELPPIALYTPRDSDEIGVLALSAAFEPLDITPATRKFFVTVRAGGNADVLASGALPVRFGIMCDAVAVERPDSLLMRPLPAPMRTPGSPVLGLGVRRNPVHAAAAAQAFVLDANLVGTHLGLFA